MIQDRYAASVGVQRWTRGGLILCCFLGRVQRSRPGVDVRGLETNCPERQCRGSWMGKHSLRQKAVLSVLRQPPANSSPAVNRKANNDKKKSCTTQGVWTTAEANIQKCIAKIGGETSYSHFGDQIRQLVEQAPLVRLARSKPLSLTNFMKDLDL